LDPLVAAKGKIITSGLHPGTGNTQIPLWERGSNVVFKDGAVKPGPQQSLIFNKGSGFLGNGVRSIDNDGEPALVWGDKKNLYRGIDPPTTVNATRAGITINALGSDSAEWTSPGAVTGISDEVTPAVSHGTGGSLNFIGTAGSRLMMGWRDVASSPAMPTDYTNTVLVVWLYIDGANTLNKISETGNAIQIGLSSDAGPLTTNYAVYYLPKSLIVTHSTWYEIELDLSAESPDETDGALDLSSVASISLGLYFTSNAGASDEIYWDEMEFGGAYTGTDLDRWSIVQFGQSVLASNGVDEVQYLADITSGVFVNLSDAGGDLPSSFRASILQKLGPYIITFNTDNDNTEARWCTEDNVLIWSPYPENSARDINLRDMNSSIKCVIEFGNSLLVVGESRAHIFQFLGAPFFFGAKKLIDGIGAVGKNAVIESGTVVFGFSAHGIYITDGLTKEYIDEPAMHSFIYEDDNKYDKTRAELVCGWEDTNDDEIYFSYPTIDGSGFTVSFSRKDPTIWSMHDYWRTAASPGELWKAAILLSETGDVFVQDESGSGSAADINPLGLSDWFTMEISYGDAAYGEQPYGGHTELD
jgi:hypothetical protein